MGNDLMYRNPRPSLSSSVGYSQNVSSSVKVALVLCSCLSAIVRIEIPISFWFRLQFLYWNKHKAYWFEFTLFKCKTWLTCTVRLAQIQVEFSSWLPSRAPGLSTWSESCIKTHQCGSLQGHTRSVRSITEKSAINPAWTTQSSGPSQPNMT